MPLFRKYALLLLLLPLWSSCQKKYTCSYNYYYLAEQVAFAGYSSSELSQIVFQKFEPGGSFTSLVSSDTVDCSAAAFQGDTAYRSIANDFYLGFFSMDDKNDYKIKVLNGGNQEYKIRLGRSGKTSETWTQTHHCSPGSGMSRMIPYNITLNGVATPSFSPTPNMHFIFLRR